MKRFVKFQVGILAVGLIGAAWAAESANKVGGGYLVYEAKQGTVAFSHLSHQTAGFQCTDCHTAIFPMKRGSFSSMAEINSGKACGKCHDGKTKAPKGAGVAHPVTDCNGCHMPAGDVAIQTKGPGPVAFAHSKHTGTPADGETAGYSCGTCHPKLFKAKAGEPIGMKFPHTAACGTCHDGKATSPSGKVAKSTTALCMTCHKVK